MLFQKVLQLQYNQNQQDTGQILLIVSLSVSCLSDARVCASRAGANSVF